MDATEEPVAERVLGPSRCLGRDGVGAAGPEPTGCDYAFLAVPGLLSQRLDGRCQLEHLPLRLDVSRGVLAELPGAGASLALCLLAVA